MQTVINVTVLLSLAVSSAVHAQASDRRQGSETPGRYNQSGGINYAPRPGVYTVVSIDSYAQTVRMRARDGRAADVYLGSDIYDLSKLKPGDRIQVNFLQPDGNNNRLSAATIWPVQ